MLIAAGAEPAMVLWQEGADRPLLGSAPPSASAPLAVPAAFVRLAEDVVCHRDAFTRWRYPRGGFGVAYRMT